MKRKILVIIMALALMLPFCACGKNESNAEREKEIGLMKEKYKDYNTTFDFAYFCKWDVVTQGRGDMELSNGATAGVKFDVPEDSFLETFNVKAKNASAGDNTIDLELYNWNTDYKTSLKRNPIMKKTLNVPASDHRISVFFDDFEVGSGEYLMVMKNTPQGVGIKFSDALDGTLGFADGEESKTVPESYVTFKKYVKEADVSDDFAKITPEKAHVIVLSGQSNASGQTMVSCLKETATAEDFAKYQEGFKDILINYSNDGSNSCEDFVPVTLGQGATPEKLGPEVGIALYLTEKYPGEKFYIVKSGLSGAGIGQHFQKNLGGFSFIVQNMNRSLKKMKADGLDPEIFAICWMQGETDAISCDFAKDYFNLQSDFADNLKAKLKKYMNDTGCAFIDAEISQSTDWMHNQVVNAHKRNYAKISVNNYCFDTRDLGCLKENNDFIHYDSQDMIELGRRFGEYISIAYENGK